jgi:hypothetical protein
MVRIVKNPDPGSYDAGTRLKVAIQEAKNTARSEGADENIIASVLIHHLAAQLCSLEDAGLIMDHDVGIERLMEALEFSCQYMRETAKMSEH